MDIGKELKKHIDHAQQRYGDFASTHEALGVASEEWDEFRDSIRENNLSHVQRECIDLAAVLIRLAHNIDISFNIKARSTK